MAGLAFQIPGGSYRRAEFVVCITPGMNRQFLLDGVRAFKQEVREFCILGRIKYEHVFFASILKQSKFTISANLLY